MRLNIKERVLLLSNLPAKGDIILLKLVQKLQQDLAFTEEEIKKYEIQTVGDKIIWKDDFEKDIEIPEILLTKIKEDLQKKSEDKELTLEWVSLWDKLF